MPLRLPSFRIPGQLLILACACLWSLGGVFIKVLTQSYQVDPRALACLRSAIAGLVLSWALPGIARAPGWKVLGAGLAYTCVVGGFVLSTSGTSAANAIFLQYAYPLFVAVGAVVLFSEPLGRRTVLAVAIGMTGIAMILVFSWRPGEQTGVAYGFMTSFAFAAFALLSRSMRYEKPMALASAYNLMAAGLLLLPAWGVLRISVPALAVLAVMATFQLGIPYVLFIKGLRTVPTTDAALITLAEPILNPLWVWLFVGEVLHGCTIVGGALIVLALLVRFTAVPGRVRKALGS
jgi:drug/metabolite transporter (DMT)-like permease